jgi:hypothetical protein
MIWLERAATTSWFWAGIAVSFVLFTLMLGSL